MKLNQNEIYDLVYYLKSLQAEYRRKIWVMEEEGKVTERVKRLFDHNVSKSDIKTLIEIVQSDIDRLQIFIDQLQKELKKADT
jgi:hypothetical protein